MEAGTPSNPAGEEALMETTYSVAGRRLLSTMEVPEDSVLVQLNFKLPRFLQYSTLNLIELTLLPRRFCGIPHDNNILRSGFSETPLRRFSTSLIKSRVI